MSYDRFQGLSYHYGDLIKEAWKEAGQDYEQIQQSVLEAIKTVYPNYQQAKILDIGIGEGDSIAPLVADGCTNITGIDINQDMLAVTKQRFGDKVKLIQTNAMNMQEFELGSFDIIITGSCIHNIPRKERPLFWQQLRRLAPTVYICSERIAYADPVKHQQVNDNELRALKKVYYKYNLNDLADEWVEHYRIDEQEKMTMEEIQENLQDMYNISTFLEMGTIKTLLCVKKGSS